MRIERQGPDTTTNIAAIATSTSATATSTGIMDDWDEGDRCKVNPIVGQAGVAAGSGASSATTQRVITATDDLGIVSLGIMDDWDESDRCKVNPIVGSAGVQGGAGAVTASTQRIAIATDANSVQGLQASGASLTANPFNIGGRAATALPTAVSDAQLVGIMTDKYGRLVVVPGSVRGLVGRQKTTISASTSETTIVTAASTIFNDVYCIAIQNTSASSDCRIDIRDTTGGAVQMEIESRGGSTGVGWSLYYPTEQSSSNTNWTAQCSASVTNIFVVAFFIKNK